MYKMIVLDIDGTLFNTKHEITPITKAALTEAQKRGYIVVLSSGRPSIGMYKVAGELELGKYGSYISAFNGGEIQKMSSNEVVFNNPLSVEDQHELFDMAHKYGTNIMTFDKNLIVTQDDDEYIHYEAASNGMNLDQVEDFKKIVNFSSVKCLITAPPEKIAEVFPKMVAEYGDCYNIATSAPFFIECTKKGVDKGNGLRHLGEILGIQLEEMIACGDGLNDLSMLKIVGLSVAMGNASDRVKEVCDYVTSSNDEDGIAHVVEKFLLCQ